MSYILDALRKAEAERHLGAAAPQANSATAQVAANTALPPARRTWLWMTLGLVGGVLAAFGWIAWQGPQPAPAALPTVLPQAAPQAPVRAPMQEAQPELKDRAGQPEDSDRSAAKPKAIEPKREKVHKKVREEAQDKPQHERPQHRKEKKAPAPRTAAPAARAPAADALPSLQELPPAIRQQIPALTVKGYLYANNPADRSVLIDNRLLREGSPVAPGLTLERLEQNGMVLNFQGHRFRRSY
jgi:general secretion pathway protein B